MGEFGTDVEIRMIEKYDALHSKMIRDIKTTDIFNIEGVGAGTVAATAVATGTTTANQELYPYMWIAGVDSGAGLAHIFALVAGNDTVAYLLVDGTSVHLKNKIISTPEAPIHRLGASSTYTIIVVGPAAGVNYYSTLVCKREPILTRVETAES